MNVNFSDQRTDEQRRRFEENLRRFPPYIREQVEAVSLDEVWERVRVEYSEDGYSYCLYRNGDGWIQITTANAARETRDWASAIVLETFSSLFLYGTGFGYALSAILSRANPQSVVIVFERDIHLFIAMLHVVDLAPLFQSHGRCIFFVGDVEEMSQHFSVLLMTENLYTITNPSVVFAPETKLFKEEYTRIHQKVFEMLVQQIFARGNDHNDSLLGFHNMIDNASVVVSNPRLSTIQRRFQDVPIFIVANGPSLDHNIAQLKKVRGRGLILCCESAIATLMKNGVSPDAIVVAERNPASYWFHFNDIQYPRNVALLALTLVDPRIWRSFSGPKVPIFRSHESNSQWLSAVLADGDGLPGGINVSHLAFDIAVSLGGDPIVFVGQDLAYGIDGDTHSRDSQYASKGQDYIEGIKTSPVVYVEANHGGSIPSTSSWVDYRKWLEKLIQENKDRIVINATEGGAKIQGTQIRTLEDVIYQYCRVDLSYSLDDIIRAAASAVDSAEGQKRLQILAADLSRYVEIYRALRKVALETMEASIRLWQQYEMNSALSTQADFESIYDHNQRTIDRFLEPKLHQVFLQLPVLYGAHQINRIGAIHTFARLRDAVRVQINTLQHLSMVCDSLVENFRIALANIEGDLRVHSASFEQVGGGA